MVSVEKRVIHGILPNDKLIQLMKEKGAKYVSFAHNYNYPYQNQVSSVHFFDSNVMQTKGLHEVGCFIPQMHSPERGDLSGFNEQDRFNAMDTAPLYELVYPE